MDDLDRARAGGTAARAPAFSEEEYRLVATAALDEFGIDVVEIEDAEPLEDRLRSYTVNERLLNAAEEVRTTGQVCFGPFITWTSES